METIILPQYFGREASSDFFVFDYKSDKPVNKQQITFTNNIFSFLLEGDKEVYTSNSPLQIDQSEFLLLKSGFCLMTEKLSSHRQHYRSILFFFSDEMLLEFIRNYEIQLSASSKIKAVQAFQYDEFIENFVQSLADIALLNPKTRKRILKVKFEEIMLYLIETKGSEFLHSIVLQNTKQAHSFVNVVESNKYKRLSLKELAFLSNMSISSFKREFVKHYDKSPMKWFQEKRLEYAAFLLKQEQKRASDIFLEVGYENFSSFIHAFKSKYGMTPKQYQEN